MKIATWNVNSVRARLERLLAWISKHQPDVLCLQELKCTNEQFPADELKALGYSVSVFGQKTYNGVALVSKVPALDVVCGIPDGEEDPQARVMAGSFGGLRVVNLYAPNGQALDAPAFQYKLKWYRRLQSHLLAARRPGQSLLLCGDFNIAPEDRDVYDPKALEGQTHVSAEERASLGALSASLGLRDVFRTMHPQDQRFSWWDYRNLSFPKNTGLRIDLLLLSEALLPRVAVCDIDREERKGKQPSDHAPVWLQLEAEAG